jgi:hypothetical protein
VRLPNDPSQKGIVDPKMFPPDPEVTRRAHAEVAALEEELASADDWRERRRIRKGIRAARSTAKHGVERPHRGATY